MKKFGIIFTIWALICYFGGFIWGSYTTNQRIEKNKIIGFPEVVIRAEERDRITVHDQHLVNQKWVIEKRLKNGTEHYYYFIDVVKDIDKIIINKRGKEITLRFIISGLCGRNLRLQGLL